MPSAIRPPVVLNDFAHDRRELRRRVGAQGLRANIAELPDAHRQRGRRGVVRRFDDRDDVVLSLCPPDVLDRAAKFCSEFLIMARAIGGILNVLDALFGEIDQRDAMAFPFASSACASPFLPKALAPLLSFATFRRSGVLRIDRHQPALVFSHREGRNPRTQT